MTKIIEKHGKVYINKNIDIKQLRPFRKKQEIILAGKSTEDFYVEFSDGRKLFVNAGEYIFEDVDKKLKTMNSKTFEKTHEIEDKIEFVTIKIRKELESSIKEFMSYFKKYKGNVSEQAMKFIKTNDVNIVAGHLILTGIETVRNQLAVIDEIKKHLRRLHDKGGRFPAIAE